MENGGILGDLLGRGGNRPFQLPLAARGADLAVFCGFLVVERTGFEPVYGKPGQIYSLLPLTTRPPLPKRAAPKTRPARKAAQWRKGPRLSTRRIAGSRSLAPACAPCPQPI